MTGLFSTITKVATIADEGTTSDAVTPGVGYTLVAVIMPTGWDAATISFQGRPRGSSTYQAIYDEAGVYQLTSAAASRNISVDPTRFFGYESIKLVASAAQTNGPRSITCVFAALG